MIHTTAQRLASTSPATVAEDADEADDVAALSADDRSLHELCEAWAAWAASRRLFGAPRVAPGTLGRLRERTRATRAEGPNAICSAELAAFHLGVISQPAGRLNRRVFELHYVARVRNIKQAARSLGIGRQHWYTLLADFRRRAFSASCEILRASAEARRAIGTPAPSAELVD